MKRKGGDQCFSFDSLSVPIDLSNNDIGLFSLQQKTRNPQFPAKSGQKRRCAAFSRIRRRSTIGNRLKSKFFETKTKTLVETSVSIFRVLEGHEILFLEISPSENARKPHRKTVPSKVIKCGSKTSRKQSKIEFFIWSGKTRDDKPKTYLKTRNPRKTENTLVEDPCLSQHYVACGHPLLSLLSQPCYIRCSHVIGSCKRTPSGCTLQVSNFESKS